MDYGLGVGGQRVRATRLMFNVNTTISTIDWILQIEMLISPKFARPGGIKMRIRKIHVNMNRNHVLDDAEMFLFLWGLAGKKNSNSGGISNIIFFRQVRENFITNSAGGGGISDWHW